MSIYSSIYHNLCEDRKKLKQLYIPYSNLHRHHIIPKHSGGLDDENNYTYLTVREHIIAHFLLWKIYKNPNDLRSMKMLGANLTSFQRKTIGIYCRDNKLGIHGAAKKERKEWILKGIETQIKNKIGIFDPKNIHKNASLGGITGSKIQIKNKIGIFDPKNIHKNASLGGKS